MSVIHNSIAKLSGFTVPMRSVRTTGIFASRVFVKARLDRDQNISLGMLIALSVLSNDLYSSKIGVVTKNSC